MKIKYINDKRTTYIDEKNIDGHSIPIIKYKIFDNYPELITGFSTRLGGVSKEHLSSMNLSFSRGDDRKNVMKNHELFAKALGYDYTKLVFSDQVHNTDLKIVTYEDAGKGIKKKSDIIGIDGLVTNNTNIPLITFYADCVPLYVYDPVNKVLALAHSGWKGTVNKIGKVVVDTMKSQFGSDENDIICAIGPSICQACYEISEDVAIKFKDAYQPEIYDEIMYYKGNGKYHLDLHKACFYNFIEAGVQENNIAMPDICTCCNSEVLFSHRASHGMRGNLAAIGMIR